MKLSALGWSTNGSCLRRAVGTAEGSEDAFVNSPRVGSCVACKHKFVRVWWREGWWSEPRAEAPCRQSLATPCTKPASSTRGVASQARACRTGQVSCRLAPSGSGGRKFTESSESCSASGPVGHFNRDRSNSGTIGHFGQGGANSDTDRYRWHGGTRSGTLEHLSYGGTSAFIFSINSIDTASRNHGHDHASHDVRFADAVRCSLGARR